MARHSLGAHPAGWDGGPSSWVKARNRTVLLRVTSPQRLPAPRPRVSGLLTSAAMILGSLTLILGTTVWTGWDFLSFPPAPALHEPFSVAPWAPLGGSQQNQGSPSVRKPPAASSSLPADQTPSEPLRPPQVSLMDAPRVTVGPLTTAAVPAVADPVPSGSRSVPVGTGQSSPAPVATAPQVTALGGTAPTTSETEGPRSVAGTPATVPGRAADLPDERGRHRPDHDGYHGDRGEGTGRSSPADVPADRHDTRATAPPVSDVGQPRDAHEVSVPVCRSGDSRSDQAPQQGHEHRVGAVAVGPQLTVVAPTHAGNGAEQRRHGQHLDGLAQGRGPHDLLRLRGMR